MSVDDVLIQIGEFGWFQKRTFALLVFTSIFGIPFMMLSVFILAVPDHRCKIPDLSNDTYKIQDDLHQTMVNKYIPASGDETLTYDQCHLYSLNTSNVYFDNNSIPLNATVVKCTSWVYSKEVFDTTFVTEHNIICDDKHKTSIAKTIFFAGVLVGSLGFGILSDMIGRRKCLLVSTFLLFVFTFGLSWAPNYTVYVILRFLIGNCVVGLFMTGFVAVMEIVGPNKRTIAGLVMGIVGTTGELYLTMASYFFGKWNSTEIAISAPILVLVFLFWFVPESPRWLVSQGKIEEAKVILQETARVNRKAFLPNMVDELANEEKPEKGRLWLLFTNRVLFVRTIILFYNWMVASMTFYGLSLNTGNLYGGYYLNFVIAAAVEFPGNTLPLFVINRFGRKKMLCLFWIIGGFACGSTIFTITLGGTVHTQFIFFIILYIILDMEGMSYFRQRLLILRRAAEF